ncbi:S8 family serine peptidase [Ilumatobacter sp.]|uniref:S8 family serine peptidase n=1 Tax=Ilumatobacter sp. TaxID=1967498 RepID=UPI003AF6CE45
MTHPHRTTRSQRSDRPRRRGHFIAQAALATTVTIALSAGLAAAGKGGNKGGGGESSGPVACADVLADGSTLSLDEVRAGMNADYSAYGGGIGVAVIDTGINQVGGLTGRSKIIDGPDLSFDALDDNLRFRDLHGHGTNMAAIIAANNSTSGDGVAPGAHLVNVKVGAGDGSVDVSQVIAAIDWVIANRNIDGNNIRVINLAYGTDSSQDYRVDPLAHAVENAWRHGIVVVVAGGNDGRGIQQLGNPAIDPYVIAVGAAEPANNGWKVPSWSSTGDGVRNPDIVAPGASVLSAGVTGSYLADTHPDATCVSNKGDVSLRGSGTSQAAAGVAGAAAVLLEDRPELTPDQVKYLLTSTAVDLGHQAKLQGHGLVDLAAALRAEIPDPGTEPVFGTGWGGTGGTTSSYDPVTQTHDPSTGLGSLDAARGSFYIGDEGDQLSGELTAFGGAWDAPTWAAASAAGTAWTNQIYDNGDNSWIGGTWSGATWSGASWSGATWSGATWSGATWSGATWSGATWSGASWSGASWSGASWSGASWSGGIWS